MVRALLLVGAIALIAVLGYRQIRRLAETKVPVIVSSHALNAGRQVARADLRPMEMSPPAGALASLADIEGRRLLKDKAPGEPFFVSDLAPKSAPPRLASTIPTGHVLATIRVGSMDLPIPELYAGDRLDVLLSTQKGIEFIARNAQVMGTLGGGHGKPNGDSGKILGIDISLPGATAAADPNLALVLAISPGDVYPLTAAEATGKKMKIVLHSEEEVRSGNYLDVKPAAPAVRVAARAAAPPPPFELIMGSKVQKVDVK